MQREKLFIIIGVIVGIFLIGALVGNTGKNAFSEEDSSVFKTFSQEPEQPQKEPVSLKDQPQTQDRGSRSTDEGTKDTKDTDEDDSRLIIRTGNLNIVVDDISKSVDKIINYAEDQGGWMVSSNISKKEKAPSGSVSVKVPAEKFSQAMEEISGIAEKVNYEKRKGKDVTEEYVDLESELDNLKATEKQLQEIMNQAENVEETLKVHDKLKDIRGEIERVKGRMQYLQQSSDMATINVNLAVSESELPIPEAEKWKPVYIAKKAWKDTVEFWKNTSYGIIEFFVKHLLTWILVLAVIGLILWKPMAKLWNKVTESKGGRSTGSGNTNLGLCSLIAGIIGIVLTFLFAASQTVLFLIIGIVLGVVGLITGIMENREGYAQAGFILGIITLAIAGLIILTGVV